jgi:hypothetical protein
MDLIIAVEDDGMCSPDGNDIPSIDQLLGDYMCFFSRTSRDRLLVGSGARMLFR